MSVTTENAPVQGQTTLQENRAGEGVYASLFEKINLAPASHLGDINDFLDDAALSEAPAAERLTAAMQVFMERIRQSGQRVEKLDKTLIDHHIAELDFQISRQLDAVMHHQEFQQVESLWRGLKQLVDNTDYRSYSGHGSTVAISLPFGWGVVKSRNLTSPWCKSNLPIASLRNSCVSVIRASF